MCGRLQRIDRYIAATTFHVSEKALGQAGVGCQLLARHASPRPPRTHPRAQFYQDGIWFLVVHWPLASPALAVCARSRLQYASDKSIVKQFIAGAKCGAISLASVPCQTSRQPRIDKYRRRQACTLAARTTAQPHRESRFRETTTQPRTCSRATRRVLPRSLSWTLLAGPS